MQPALYIHFSGRQTDYYAPNGLCKMSNIARALAAQGYDTFVELGAGRTLCGLVRRIDRGLRVLNAEDGETLEAIRSEE